ncbi:pilus assembly protein PilP [Rodentibacter caecimuris]|uniref:Pilus assembly protein PilP n=1 Tax=Rodentibacter caecimuris TaxID=1796644 RepID=A0ABX3L0D5_9PAST|nr:hypothetical protein BKG89_01685 [Rodentibacter heylii]
MNKILLSSLFVIAISADAQDPFDRNQRKTASPSTAPNKTIFLPCDTQSQRIAEQALFKQLKLVGIIHYNKERTKALFINENEQIFIVQAGDYIAQEGYKIQEIQKNQISFANYQPGQCQYPELFVLTL